MLLELSDREEPRRQLGIRSDFWADGSGKRVLSKVRVAMLLHVSFPRC